jgi:HD-like signal output (HDOD) protein
MDQSYVEIGRQLADEWNFPSSVKEAINLHQPHSYHLATSPTKGASITGLARELASVHLNSPPISTERLRTLPVVRALNISGDMIDGISQSKQDIQVQIDSLLI